MGDRLGAVVNCSTPQFSDFFVRSNLRCPIEGRLPHDPFRLETNVEACRMLESILMKLRVQKPNLNVCRLCKTKPTTCTQLPPSYQTQHNYFLQAVLSFGEEIRRQPNLSRVFRNYFRALLLYTPQWLFQAQAPLHFHSGHPPEVALAVQTCPTIQHEFSIYLHSIYAFFF